MDALDRLRAAAKAKRDAAHEAADREYRHALREIRAVERRLAKASPKPPPAGRLKQGSAVSYAEKILAERGPLTLLELAVAVKEAGFRAKSERSLLSNLRSSMQRQSGRFWEAGEFLGTCRLRTNRQ